MDGRCELNVQVVIQIDRSESSREPYRYTCPNGDSSWEPLSTHIWCRCCSERGEKDEHWHLLDQKTDELIPFSDVEVV